MITATNAGSLDGKEHYSFTCNIQWSSWANEATKYMNKIGIITGDTQGNFMPKAVTPAQEAAGYGMATREQAIALSVRTHDKAK